MRCVRGETRRHWKVKHKELRNEGHQGASTFTRSHVTLGKRAHADLSSPAGYIRQGGSAFTPVHLFDGLVKNITQNYRTDYQDTWWKDAVWVGLEDFTFCRGFASGGGSMILFLSFFNTATFRIFIDLPENDFSDLDRKNLSGSSEFRSVFMRRVSGLSVGMRALLLENVLHSLSECVEQIKTKQNKTNQGIAWVVWFHPLGTMNVITYFIIIHFF